MNHTRPPITLATLTIALLAIGCGGAPADTADEATAPTAGETETAAPVPEETAGIAFEPAYPEEVSTDELTAEDTAQQETHEHGGEEHTHEERPQDDHGHDH